MHEYGLMESVIARALEVGVARGATSVARVDVEVGELAFASRSALETAFCSLSRGTILEGAELVLTEVPGLVRCDSCGRTGGIETIDSPEEHGLLLPLCRACGSPLAVLGGRGLTLTNLTLNLPDAPEVAEADEAMSGS